jgi:hypothetical protein
MGEPIKVEFLSQSAEEPLPLADASIGTGRHDLDIVFHPKCC